ncbi:MAG TPA: nitroreductase family deazaflavin-dependent oxidoreductase [Thermomicrobiales bacterium]|jgi:deazaflavin-dependent oxidoreductase (nitroreductase family)|nr:nitroreductase family deazaflavin-dependent oxidoreductase [Thermomicrobiales bacterium]
MAEGKSFNERIIEEFRANGGKVGGPFEGAPMLILTTTGARSGRSLVTPLVSTPEADRWLIYASAAGADRHPDWYHNLVANPEVTVEVGTETFPARATVITGDERDRLYAEQVQRMPGFGGYQAKTSRVIPVVELRRAES